MIIRFLESVVDSVDADEAETIPRHNRPGASANVTSDPEEAARKVPVSLEEYMPPRRVEGALEGESMTISHKSGGQTEIQNIPAFNWSNNRQVWWKHGKVGGRLVIEFDVENAGKRQVIAALTKARDYGIVDVSINGAKILSDFDLYNTNVITEEVDLGQCDLKAGKNKLEIIITGSNSKAVKSFMFGLDYLLIK